MNDNLPIDQQDVDEIKQTEKWIGKEIPCPKCGGDEYFEIKTEYPNGFISLFRICDDEDCKYQVESDNKEHI